MKHIFIRLAALLIAGVMLSPGGALSGTVYDVAKKTDQGLNAAGQKVDSSTKGAQNATAAAGQKASKATKSGMDKVGKFFQKTENTVEDWMRSLENKTKD